MVYVFLAKGFEELEALAPVDVLRRAGVEVKLVGVTGKQVRGSHGIAVSCDITIDLKDLNEKATTKKALKLINNYFK